MRKILFAGLLSLVLVGCKGLVVVDKVVYDCACSKPKKASCSCKAKKKAECKKGQCTSRPARVN